MIRSLSLALALSPALSLAAQPAFAQTGDWSFGLGAATDNRSKDASKSEGDPYVWGLAEWESSSGFFYAGPGFETVRSGGSRLELELGGGIRPQIAGFDVDLNATHKWRVDADPGEDDDAWEFTANIDRSIGPAKARLQLQHSPDGAGSVKAWTWVEGQIGWDFTGKLSGSAAVGRREQDGAPDYTGWNIGGTYALTRSLELELRYYDTDAKAPGDQYASALVAGLSVYF